LERPVDVDPVEPDRFNQPSNINIRLKAKGLNK
jgi:hypothetical protein